MKTTIMHCIPVPYPIVCIALHTQVADDKVGANCSILAGSSPSSSPRWPGGKVPVEKPRFQEGSVDEVCFLAPELGALAGILVAPEGGSWVLDEINVNSSRSKAMDRFVARRRLGGRKGELAAFLTPVPPGAVVYGSGDAAVILTKVRLWTDVSAASIAAVARMEFAGAVH